MTITQLKRYNDFLFIKDILAYKKEIVNLYRGDSLKNTCEKLDVKYLEDKTDIDAIFEKIFMIGDKAKYFLFEDKKFKIDSCEDALFKKIFDNIGRSIKNKKTGINRFFEENSSLKDFFSDKKNKTNFLDKIKEASHSEKLEIRDYYLTLLHQLGAIDYKSKSHLVSTSYDPKVADNFASHNDEKYKLIFHCWQPIKIQKHTVKKFDLPCYNRPPFPDQKEHTLLGGILPHFIHMIEFTSIDKFIINPNILEQDINILSFYHGLNIDQSNFYEVLESTNYIKSFHTDGISFHESTS